VRGAFQPRRFIQELINETAEGIGADPLLVAAVIQAPAAQ
jgi:hypothetical protein